MGKETPKETVSIFLNVKLEREWIFNVVNDKKIQFKTEFGTDDQSERLSWTNSSEKVSFNIIFYFLTLLIRIMEI